MTRLVSLAVRFCEGRELVSLLIPGKVFALFDLHLIRRDLLDVDGQEQVGTSQFQQVNLGITVTVDFGLVPMHVV